MFEMQRLGFLLMLSLFGIFFCIWQHVQCFKMAESLSKEEKKLKKKKDIQRELLVKYARLSSLERIEKIALEQLGLVFASSKTRLLADSKDSSEAKPEKSSQREENFLSGLISQMKNLPSHLKSSFPLRSVVFLGEELGSQFLQIADASHLDNPSVKKHV